MKSNSDSSAILAAGVEFARQYILNSKSGMAPLNGWQGVPLKEMQASMPTALVEAGYAFPDTVSGTFKSVVNGSTQDCPVNAKLGSLMFCWGRVMRADRSIGVRVVLVAYIGTGYVACPIGLGKNGLIPVNVFNTDTPCIDPNLVRLLGFTMYNTVNAESLAAHPTGVTVAEPLTTVEAF